MILSCVVPPPFPLPVLLPPHALSRRTKMMPITRPNRRPCRLHTFIDCLLSVFDGHLRDRLKCWRQPADPIDRAVFLLLIVLPISALDGHVSDWIGPPPEQATFQRGDKELRQQRHRCQ